LALFGLFCSQKDVFEYYNLIQRLQEEENKRDTHTPIDVADSSRVTSSAAMAKRRRLTFSDEGSSHGKGQG